MDVARMNFSHGDYADHKAAYERVRAASDATGRAVGVLADLQGPKIRLGRFATGSTFWADGEAIRITVANCEGTHDRVSTTYKRLAKDAAVGDRVLASVGLGGFASRVVVPADASESLVLERALADEKVRAAIAGKQIVKRIYVPGKMVNIVIK